jgi:hypothetical protein
MYLWNSSDELVPIAQWQDMKTALAAAGIPFKATELQGSRHSNAYTHVAFCPTVAFLTSYLGPYTGTCVAPPNGSGTDYPGGAQARAGTTVPVSRVSDLVDNAISADAQNRSFGCVTDHRCYRG